MFLRNTTLHFNWSWPKSLPFFRNRQEETSPLLPPPLPTLAAQLQQPEAALPPMVRLCPVAMNYYHLLGQMDWQHFPERPNNRAWPGPTPHPRAPFVAAFLIKVDRQLKYMSHLRQFLVEHPALFWLLGFQWTPDETCEWGFNPKQCVPSSKRLGAVLRSLPNQALQFLLTNTVHLLQDALPKAQSEHFAEEVSVDTKHIIAWIRENNLKTHVSERYDKTKQPQGDKDCKLGFKPTDNRPPRTPTTDGQPAK